MLGGQEALSRLTPGGGVGGVGRWGMEREANPSQGVAHDNEGSDNDLDQRFTISEYQDQHLFHFLVKSPHLSSEINTCPGITFQMGR